MSKKYTRQTGRSRRKAVRPRGRVDAVDAATVPLTQPGAEVIADLRDGVERAIALEDYETLLGTEIIDATERVIDMQSLAGKRRERTSRVAGVVDVGGKAGHH